MNKITIKTFSSPCPTQCEGYFDKVYPFYFRERWGDYTFTLANETVKMEDAYKREGEMFFDSGSIDFIISDNSDEISEEEMMRFLEELYEKWQEHKALPLQKRAYEILKKIAEIVSESNHLVSIEDDRGYGSGTLTINKEHTHFGIKDEERGEVHFINGLFMSLMKGKNNEENGNNKE